MSDIFKVYETQKTILHFSVPKNKKHRWSLHLRYTHNFLCYLIKLLKILIILIVFLPFEGSVICSVLFCPTEVIYCSVRKRMPACNPMCKSQLTIKRSDGKRLEYDRRFDENKNSIKQTDICRYTTDCEGKTNDGNYSYTVLFTDY